MKLRLELVSHGGNTAGFEIPDDVVEELGGGRRPKVVVTVGGHTWRSSIVNMGGTFMLGVSLENRAAAGVAAGETLDVEITLDTAPRTVDLPDDLAAELERDATACAAWETWSFTRQKEAARSLTEARKPETRARRLEKVLAELRG
jgi:antitoxin component of MazEF toxin-antitoxin module